MQIDNAVLSNIQTGLAVSKSRKNQFGKFNYRNTADICEALKPLLVKYECHLKMSDEVVLVGDRYYVKATSSLYGNKAQGGILGSASAFAREPLEKKGMDSPQVTVTTSSYARKQSLCGLLAIDENDTIDRDSHAPAETKGLSYERKAAELSKLISGDDKRLSAMISYFKVNDMSDMTESQITEAIRLIS